MNLYHLRYFVTLAHLEHYTKAADELLITQPSLSHAIASLESELGTALFEKQGRNVCLTKYGRTFLDYVEKSLDVLDNGIKMTKAITSPTSGHIDLAFIYTLGSHFVPQAVSSFLSDSRYKNVTFSFSAGNTTDIIKGLKDEKYDIAFCSKEDEPDVEFSPISEQKLVLIVPEGHPLAQKRAIDLRETAGYRQIFFTKTSGLRPVIDELFNKIGVTPNIVYEVEEDGTIAGLVAKNFGIAIIPQIPILNFMKLKVLKITSPAYKRYVYLARAKRKYTAPVVNEFSRFVLENLKI